MLATIGIIILILWLVGVLAFKTVGAVIHIALIVGVILIVLHFVRGRRST
jgi:hypothetical protein